ncbi:MAG: efflux RND transporter periplasmic adaptor subunit [Anaerolineales bacterium]|jgi:HlyD family secretion protein
MKLLFSQSSVLRSTWLYWLAALFLFLPLLVGCAGQAAGEQMPTAVPTPVLAQKPTYTVQRGTVTRTLRLTGRAAPVQQQDLFFRTDGFVREIYVARGDSVQAGDVLARLDEPEKYTSDIANAQIELEKANHDLELLEQEAPLKAAEAQLAMVEAGQALKDAQRDRTKMDYNRDSEELDVDKAHTDYLLAKQVLKDAQKAFNKVAHKKPTDPERVIALKALVDAQNVYDRAFAIWNWYLLPWSEDEVDQADADLALALAQYDQAKVRWELLQQGPDPYELKLAQARVADNEARLASAQKALENIELRAPFDGQVLSIGISSGSQVTAFKGVLTLADPETLEIVLYPTSDDLAAIGVGQAATVQLATRSGESLSAHVRQIPFSAGASDGDETQVDDRSVRIELDDASQSLTLNEAATVVIELETRQDVLWLPPAALRTFQGRDFVFIEENGVQRRVDVQLGLHSAERVEIVEGLREEQVVIGQ